MTKKYAVSGFTLVEMMTVMACIAALTAILIPTFFDHIERANNAADLTNIHNMINEVNTAFMTNEDQGFYDNCWGWETNPDNKDMGYIYVDNDEVRVSNDSIAMMLERMGYISDWEHPDKKRGPESCYTIHGNSRLRCQSSRQWCRYQIDFRRDYVQDDLWWGITCATRSTTSVNKAGTIKEDPCDEVATRAMAERVGVEPYYKNLGNQE